MAQAHREARQGGAEIGKRDKLRIYLDVLREAYDIAATPPALDYHPLSSNTAPSEEYEELLRRNRNNLLIMGIDAKYAVQRVLESLPKARADVLKNWIMDGSKYAEYQLSHKKRLFLKYDRLALNQALRVKDWT